VCKKAHEEFIRTQCWPKQSVTFQYIDKGATQEEINNILKCVDSMHGQKLIICASKTDAIIAEEYQRMTWWTPIRFMDISKQTPIQFMDISKHYIECKNIRDTTFNDFKSGCFTTLIIGGSPSKSPFCKWEDIAETFSVAKPDVCVWIDRSNYNYGIKNAVALGKSHIFVYTNKVPFDIYQ